MRQVWRDIRSIIGCTLWGVAMKIMPDEDVRSILLGVIKELDR